MLKWGKLYLYEVGSERPRDVDIELKATLLAQVTSRNVLAALATCLENMVQRHRLSSASHIFLGCGRGGCLWQKEVAAGIVGDHWVTNVDDVIGLTLNLSAT